MQCTLEITFFFIPVYYTHLSTLNSFCLLFLIIPNFFVKASLQKRPFITAHFRSSLHIFVHDKTSPALRKFIFVAF